jgi:serine/threonine-protein phosphatase 2A regulatory subunit A
MAVEPLELYRSELAVDDISARLVTAKKTPLVARALGPERAAAELIPCIDEEVDQCPDDELLACLATQLGEIRALVADKSDMLLTLEKLCKTDETLVRQAAVESLQRIGADMSDDEVNAGLAPLVKRLLSEAWWTSKVSAAGLIATAYPKAADEIKGDLKTSLAQITKDETPMVRRAVATNLGGICAVLEPDCVARDLLPSFNKLKNDDQDSVRILCFASCVAMCSTQPEAQCAEFVHPAIDAFGKDASWRVRLEVAKALEDLVEAIPGGLPVEMCCNMLKDPELDVRRFALEKVAVVCRGDADSAESSGILAALADLADVDIEVPNAHLMKTSLAKQSLALANIVGREATQAHLIPILVKLIQEDAVEVRIAVLEDWAELVAVAGGESVLAALPLEVLATDQSWRVRRSFLTAIPLVAKEVPRGEFDANILPLLIELVSKDQVGSVREAGAQVLADRGEVFGEEFARGTTLPLVEALAAYDGTGAYSFRITACQVHPPPPSPPIIIMMTIIIIMPLCFRVLDLTFELEWLRRPSGCLRMLVQPILATRCRR